MDSCFTCDTYNKCPFQTEYGNQIGCREWRPQLNVIYGSKPSCSFCDSTHEDFDSMNCVYDNVLTLETAEWDTYNDCSRYVTLEAHYCPICGRKLRKE